MESFNDALKACITAALLSCAFTAQAETEVVVHGVSHHTHVKADGTPWNQVNPGVAFRGLQASA